MNDKRNSDRDKVLEDILNDFSSPGKKGSASAGSGYNRRQTAEQRNQRKTVNPAAFSGKSANRTTGFAVTRMPDSEPVHTDTESKTAVIDPPAADTGSFKEYTINVKKPVQRENRAEAEERDHTGKVADTETGSTAPERTGVRKAAAGDRPAGSRKKRSRKRKKRSARLPVVLMLTTIIFTVAICLSIVIIAVGRDMLAIGKSDSIKMVTIPKGADARSVSQLLEDEGIIEIPKAFEIVSKLSGADGSFIPGQYELSPSDAYETIITKLTTAFSDEDRESVDITFVEGISIYDAAKLLEENNVCEAEKFIFYFNAGGFGFDFEDKLPTSTASKFYRMEGYLFPDTYRFYVESDPESVCMKIYQNFENKITDEYYQQMQKMGMTLDEVITLASMVQAEAPTAESMKMVASVFENRLADADEFPMLQSDPTTYYVEEIIKPNIQVPSNAIFEAYDTYKGHGLPPGAIGNPGIDAIEAVLYPADTDYYYFCADIDTREIFYAETIEEHEENLAVINGETADEDEEDYYYE
ncbi:MAG: endolytic transglycosylase MltG [Porcipelethomonas sp.]